MIPSIASQARFALPIGGIYPIGIAEANHALELWKHKLGPVNRPFRQEAYALDIDGRLISVAVSASAVNHAAGYRRTQIVELARLASCEPWANRVMLRLWREVCAPRWACWPVLAVISYSKNAMHSGDLYRFDGWEKVSDDCGSSGGGTWSKPRGGTEPKAGKKTLWLYRYEA